MPTAEHFRPQNGAFLRIIALFLRVAATTAKVMFRRVKDRLAKAKVVFTNLKAVSTKTEISHHQLKSGYEQAGGTRTSERKPPTRKPKPPTP
jgi:hypothetical protein